MHISYLSSMDQCRFCLEESPLSTLVDPCRCRGSVRYVHTTCLNRELRFRRQVGDISKACRICKAEYSTPKNYSREILTVLFFGGIGAYSTYLLVNYPAQLTILLVTLLVNYLLGISHAFESIDIGDWYTMMFLLELGFGLFLPLPPIIPLEDLYMFASYAIPIVNHSHWLGRIQRVRSEAYCILGHLLFAEVILLLLAFHSEPDIPSEAGLILSMTYVLPTAVVYSVSTIR